MMFKKKTRYKPLYKQFLKLRENVQRREKLFHFERKKWKVFQTLRFKRVKAKDQMKYVTSRYLNRRLSYMKRYKNFLITNKKFKLFYGGLLKHFVKKRLYLLSRKSYKNIFIEFLMFFEYRLDVVLHRCHFTESIREARQLIVHNKVFVNKKLVAFSSYILKSGDSISIHPRSFKLIKQKIKKSFYRFIPSKHLFINYKTLQIVCGCSKNINVSLNFPYYLNLEKIITSRYQN